MTDTELAETAARRPETPNLALLSDVEVRLSVEVGATSLRIRDLLALNEGSVVELDRYSSEMLDVLVNGTLLARGEVVTIGDRLGVRVTEVAAVEGGRRDYRLSR